MTADNPLKSPATRAVHAAARRYHSLPFLPGHGLALTAVGLLLAHAAAASDAAARMRAVGAGLALLVGALLAKLTEALVKLGPERLLALDREMEASSMLAFEPPPLRLVDALMAPVDAVLRTEAVHLERVPPLSADTPCLFVMNHSLLGLEMASFVHLLYKRKGFVVRGLADHMHFAAPHAALLKAAGAVDGTRANVDALMGSRQSLLVYPGGGEEILKHSSVDRYKLLWKERLGFARMAIKHGYPVLPCAAVGTEDMLDTLLDLPAGFLRRGLTVPLVLPPSPCRLQKVYFWFGEPIPTTMYGGDHANDAFARELRDKARDAVEVGIAELKARQEADPERYLMARGAAGLRVASEAFREAVAAAIFPGNGSGGDGDKKWD